MFTTQLIDSAQTMAQWGKKLALICPPQLTIHLIGELGAGKTTFVRGFINALGHQGIVKSPTYTLVEPYKLPTHQLYHFDLYRLTDPEELEYMGIRDYLAETAVCVFEWAERGGALLGTPDLVIELHYRTITSRELNITAQTPAGKITLAQLT
ncbi:tRNA (adenosine(37)-N6)-threonylcarbamoyltransferase complex ATPase subunit type 1 TsaE [Beggiatoa leptomitoformis]|uniref:tRNA threonylcarbamoyladenosine biosynthesis protein TsaE n=1 Tax=Beggiatoa leptomitoformis TaxID=288004 RepID=A0A2N9YC98_9GAMM|nr:tRNA (adenosine(37)-N6)-threonylcarbamoyltransferase complex ATPase subunit type 1 TsaE [Beggiatoa leptomitoformis]ALG66593.1 tRNA (adenosine(37)-N6)-threonylcarbamoyltransferase complex ATPase subunit type 1 TsaE [Beggiatoa leptomitoformis]AUI68097.1 tRNA (adenosine(37)-N6)-threonylcarbamoyltransferase complex ATPase subunit type 1 TsaE [Beggiatoa leptomitoformis]